ncbi:hypothetical protein RND71_021344 [Anisodus tanguticus]|uniref:Uncharacterized protein n=1 Tax=Anisodus tanguticus TaxID=243964 RepID=A0AAE1RWR5_9SOLA|nr:hypothetical protein RND71_021344 [Anisodus tanguticus]
MVESTREFFFEQLVTISTAVSLKNLIQSDPVIFKAPKFLNVLQPQVAEKFLSGLTVRDNLWSMKSECLKPARWVLFHWGELRLRMGSWVQQLTQANFGEVKVEKFDREDVPYCFEKAVVMRHEISKMGQENKLKVFDLLRCKARSYCGSNPTGKGREMNERGFPIIRLTLLMRRGSRSFKNATAVTDIFAKECARVEGCILHVVQSEDLSFCDQLTNMLFMDRKSSVMEFYPKGWLEYAGSGQYAYHWMANQSGMKHQGAWWDPFGEECPSPQDRRKCFSFHKDGMVGHNETYFAEWARRVINQVKLIKLELASADQANKQQHDSKACITETRRISRYTKHIGMIQKQGHEMEKQYVCTAEWAKQ